MSASDPNLKCKVFIEENYAGNAPTHWYLDIDSQYRSKPCVKHMYAHDGCDPCPVGCGHPDFAITGSPCHPFSLQRSTRFENMVDHHEYDTTMSTLLCWAKRFEPKCWVMEQVQGFDMAFSKDSAKEDTPYRRRR